MVVRHEPWCNTAKKLIFSRQQHMPLTHETRALITMLAPGTTIFRRVQRAHRSFRVDATHQYLARTWFRRVIKRSNGHSRSFKQALPCGRTDGYSIVFYADGARSCAFYASGKQYGTYVHYRASGSLSERHDHYHHTEHSRGYIRIRQYNEQGKLTNSQYKY